MWRVHCSPPFALLSSESAEYCRECCLTDILCSYARLLISFCHIQFESELSSRYITWSGKGVTSFHMFSFCCYRLNTVLSVPFFFGIHSIDVACFVAAVNHHAVMVYHSILQASSEQNTSGHLGSLCLSCFDSSIKGISCDTSWIGGNFNRSGPNKSLYFSAISSRSWGMSEHVYSLSSFFKPTISWVGQFTLSFLSLLGCDFFR